MPTRRLGPVIRDPKADVIEDIGSIWLDLAIQLLCKGSLLDLLRLWERIE